MIPFLHFSVNQKNAYAYLNGSRQHHKNKRPRLIKLACTSLLVNFGFINNY